MSIVAGRENKNTFMHTLKLIDKKHKRINFVTNMNLGIRYIGIIEVGYGIKNVNVPKNNEIGVS